MVPARLPVVESVAECMLAMYSTSVELQRALTMQLSLSRTTPVTPRCLNLAKSSEAMEGTLSVGCRMLGLKTACTVALMPAQLAIPERKRSAGRSGCWS